MYLIYSIASISSLAISSIFLKRVRSWIIFEVDSFSVSSICFLYLLIESPFADSTFLLSKNFICSGDFICVIVAISSNKLVWMFPASLMWDNSSIAVLGNTLCLIDRIIDFISCGLIINSSLSILF